MEKIDYLIIGGGIAGTTAAETIRQHDRQGSIAIISDEPYRLYSRIMLSKPGFFLERIPFDHIWLKTQAWYQERNINLVLGEKAVALYPDTKQVTLRNGKQIAYDRLLLATGVHPNKLGIPGEDLPGVRYLRTLDDAKVVIKAAKETKRAVIIGGGFIGFEMCDMFRLAERGVSLVIREPHYWDPVLDKPSGQMIEKVLEAGGVEIVRDHYVNSIEGSARVEGVVLDDGTRIKCDFVIIGVGCCSELDWIKAAGVGVNQGILANEFLETSLASVWTAGDVAEFHDVVLSEQIQLGNWVNAQVQGRIAGANMVGKQQAFRFVSFYTTQGFGITIGFIGDVRPEKDREIICRGSKENGYGRIFVKEEEVVGATLINRSFELGVLGRIIERDIKVGDKFKELGDEEFDLNELL